MLARLSTSVSLGRRDGFEVGTIYNTTGNRVVFARKMRRVYLSSSYSDTVRELFSHIHDQRKVHSPKPKRSDTVLQSISKLALYVLAELSIGAYLILFLNPAAQHHNYVALFTVQTVFPVIWQYK